MALRLSTRLVFASSIRRLSSQATTTATATATSTSNLPPSFQQSINRDASLPNPDPSGDSPSATLTAQHLRHMVATYSRPSVMFVKGEGSYLWDLENRKYLDFTAGIAVNGLGHADPALARLIADQASTLLHTSNLYFNPWTGALSEQLVQKTVQSGGMHDAESVFVCNSGSEANEAAIKFARKVGKTLDPTGSKYEMVSFRGSFHGRTMGSLSATPNPKYQEPFSPMVPGFKYGTYNDVAAIPGLVTEKTCGVIIEPIQGEGGVNVATNEFLIALAKRCREVGAVLIYDEIQCDIITSAKALGNGFPVAAVITNSFVSDKIKIGDHGTTYGGNPMACRIAHHVVERLADAALREGVVAKGKMLKEGLEQLRHEFPDLIGEIRGRGLIVGAQLTQDPSPIIKAARERGLLIITCGTNTLRFVPPLTISDDEIRTGLRILSDAIKSTR
ncbi:acetylornithine and succinylornithine aminotransferase [Nemania serpens]|nr:acetylornithine and succinylornithine aminotransferase [Nemania serpens]